MLFRSRPTTSQTEFVPTVWIARNSASGIPARVLITITTRSKPGTSTPANQTAKTTWTALRTVIQTCSVDVAATRRSRLNAIPITASLELRTQTVSMADVARLKWHAMTYGSGTKRTRRSCPAALAMYVTQVGRQAINWTRLGNLFFLRAMRIQAFVQQPAHQTAGIKSQSPGKIGLKTRVVIPQNASRFGLDHEVSQIS